MRIKVFALNKHDRFVKKNRNIKIGDEFEVRKVFKGSNRLYLGQDAFYIYDNDGKPIVLYDEEIIVMGSHEN